jgi:hypothetical protein
MSRPWAMPKPRSLTLGKDCPGKIARTSRETFLYLPGKRCRYRKHMNKAETKTSV